MKRRREVLDHFSGTLCVDELHLGRFTLLLAADPLANLPVAFALVDRNDQDLMRRLLKNHQVWGLAPQVVVTDGRRHLIVKRRERLTESERADLVQMLVYLTELTVLRRFADRIYGLFDTPRDLHRASCRRAALTTDPAFRAVPSWSGRWNNWKGRSSASWWPI
jgi:hypothetical protein